MSIVGHRLRLIRAEREAQTDERRHRLCSGRENAACKRRGIEGFQLRRYPV